MLNSKKIKILSIFLFSFLLTSTYFIVNSNDHASASNITKKDTTKQWKKAGFVVTDFKHHHTAKLSGKSKKTSINLIAISIATLTKIDKRAKFIVAASTFLYNDNKRVYYIKQRSYNKWAYKKKTSFAKNIVAEKVITEIYSDKKYKNKISSNTTIRYIKYK